MSVKETSILSILLPKAITNDFEVTEVREEGGSVIMVLKEKSIMPPEHKDKNLKPKGFFRPTMVQDFPIREYKVFLEVYRRKWYDPVSGKNYSRKLSIKADGTSLTKEFADFLKEAAGWVPDQYQPAR